MRSLVTCVMLLFQNKLIFESYNIDEIYIDKDGTAVSNISIIPNTELGGVTVFNDIKTMMSRINIDATEKEKLANLTLAKLMDILPRHKNQPSLDVKNKLRAGKTTIPINVADGINDKMYSMNNIVKSDVYEYVYKYVNEEDNNDWIYMFYGSVAGNVIEQITDKNLMKMKIMPSIPIISTAYVSDLGEWFAVRESPTICTQYIFNNATFLKFMYTLINVAKHLANNNLDIPSYVAEKDTYVKKDGTAVPIIRYITDISHIANDPNILTKKILLMLLTGHSYSDTEINKNTTAIITYMNSLLALKYNNYKKYTSLARDIKTPNISYLQFEKNTQTQTQTPIKTPTQKQTQTPTLKTQQTQKTTTKLQQKPKQTPILKTPTKTQQKSPR